MEIKESPKDQGEVAGLAGRLTTLNNDVESVFNLHDHALPHNDLVRFQTVCVDRTESKTTRNLLSSDPR